MDHCGLEDPAIAASAPRVPDKARASSVADLRGVSAVRRMRDVPLSGAAYFGTVGHGAAGGALAGKTVYVSAGHGFYWLSGTGWRTQRGNAHDMVEDFISAETLSHFLIPMLRNMGAYVVPVRESGLNPNLAIVDDDDAADASGAGLAIEGDLVPREGTLGFGHLPIPITDQSNPHAAGGSLELDAADAETGRLVWTFEVPEDGAYNVYVSYAQDPSRARDAHYIVRHAGGETHFRVDQRRHGSTWVLLGRFQFEAGISPVYGAVALANDSGDAGATLSADAVRIGGGVGVIDRSGGVSGRPMFENAARYAAQLNGAPASVYDYSSADNNDDVGTRSRFTAWDVADGEDAVYVAWHTNAPDPGRGTSSFAYGPEPFGTLADFAGVPGSLELLDAVHSELVSDIRAVWEPTWQDRGQRTAYFGEVNPNHNPFTPAILVEVAFHDTAADATSLRDPRFRLLASRAIAQGVARYFADKDGVALTLPPEPPRALVMGQDDGDDNNLVIRWRPAEADPAGGDPATGYRVYLSADGRAFDEGRDVPGTEPVTEFVVESPPGVPVYARVTATNAGGESLPSPVVGARLAATPRAQVLVVGGFERLDRTMLIDEDLSGFALGNIQRGFIERINDRSHVARHGDAIAAAGVSFDAVTADAIITGDMDLAEYTAVDWALGEESSCCDPLSAAERAALSGYLDAGGRLLISGSELAWALGAVGTADDAAYLADALHAGYLADDAETYAVRGTGGPLAELGEIRFDDGGPGGYDVDWPDVLEPLGGAEAVMAYDGGIGGDAAIWFEDAATGERLLMLGFPFETVSGAGDRERLMAAALAGFGVEPDEPPVGPDDPDDPDDPDAELGAGCGCRTGGPDGGWALLLLATLLALRRRSHALPRERA